MQRFVSHSVQDTEKIAAKLAEKLKGGEVIAFTGPMGMGKTAFALNLALNAAKKSGKDVVLFQLEMSKDQLASRLLSQEALIDSQKL